MPLYPSTKATLQDLFLAVNNKATNLTAGIDDTTLTIPVTSTTGFPTDGYISIDNEIIHYTSVGATQFNADQRGADGSTAAAHSNNAQVSHQIVADHHNAIVDELIAIIDDLVDNIRPNLTILRNNFYNNILVNGGFEVWQRGTSFVAIGAEAYSADKWITNDGGDTSTITQETTPANVHSGGSALHWNITAAGSPGTSKTGQYINEGVESLRGLQVTFAIWVKTTQSNVRLRFNDDDGNSVLSSYHSGSGSYERLTATITVGSAATFIECDVGHFDTDTHETGSIYLDDAVLSVGATAQDFVPEPADIMYQRCYRYFEQKVETNQYDWSVLNSGAGDAIQSYIPFAQEKPGTPVISVTLVNATIIGNAVHTGLTNSDQANWSAGADNINKRGFRFTSNATTDRGRPLALMRVDWSAEY